MQTQVSNLLRELSSVQYWNKGSIYVRCVIVKLKVMVYYGVIGMVELQQVLQRPGSFIFVCLDIVGINRNKVDCRAGGGLEKTRKAKRI